MTTTIARARRIAINCFRSIARVFVCQAPSLTLPPPGCTPGTRACCDDDYNAVLQSTGVQLGGRRSLRATKGVESRDVFGQQINVESDRPVRVHQRARWEGATCWDNTGAEYYGTDVDDCCPPRCFNVGTPRAFPAARFSTCEVFLGAEWPPAERCLRVQDDPPHIYSLAGAGGLHEAPGLVRLDGPCTDNHLVPCIGARSGSGCSGEAPSGRYYVQNAATPRPSQRIWEELRISGDAHFVAPNDSPQSQAHYEALNGVMSWLISGNTVGGIRFDRVDRPLTPTGAANGPITTWTRSIDLAAAGAPCDEWPVVATWTGCRLRDRGTAVTVHHVVRSVFWAMWLDLHVIREFVRLEGDTQDRLNLRIKPIIRLNLYAEMGLRAELAEPVDGIEIDNGDCRSPRVSGDALVYVDNSDRTFDLQPPRIVQWKGLVGAHQRGVWPSVYNSLTDDYRDACGFGDESTCCAIARALDGTTIPAHPDSIYGGSMTLGIAWEAGCRSIEDCESDGSGGGLPRRFGDKPPKFRFAFDPPDYGSVEI